MPASIPIRPRVLYSSIFVWTSLSGGRFLAPQLQNAGLSDSQIGVCFALQTVLSSICSTGSGSLADGLEQRHPGKGRVWVLMGGVSVGTIAFLLQGLATLHWHIIALRCLYAGANSFVHPILDGLTLDFLANQQGSVKADYGKERLYGAIWWAIANLVMGPSLDSFGFAILYPYTLASAICVLGTLVLYTRDRTGRIDFEVVATTEEGDAVPPPGLQRRKSHLVVEGDNNNNNNNLPLHKLVGLVCGTTFGMAFMIAVLALSIGTSVVESLIFLYFEVLGSTYTLCSITVLLTVAFEIPILGMAPQLLETYGTTKLLLLACLCYVTRVVGYSLIPQGQPWWVLLLEPLHGITYACDKVSGTEFVTELVPKGYDASGQGMLYAIKGCGSIIGLLFGGIGEDWLGPRTMYRLLAAVVAVGFTLLTLAAFLKPEPIRVVPVVTTKDISCAEESEVELVDQQARNDEEDSG